MLDVPGWWEPDGFGCFTSAEDQAFGGFEAAFLPGGSTKPTSSSSGLRLTAAATDQLSASRIAIGAVPQESPLLSLDLERWLIEHHSHPIMHGSLAGAGRNTEWFHMLNADVISMPDKWEYPRYAAWDLAFHTVTLSIVDFDFAKQQPPPTLDQPLFPPEWADPGLRVELQRRQSAGARLGDALAVQVRAAVGSGGSPIPGAGLSGLAAELQLVGEPQGPWPGRRLRRGFLGLDNIGVFDRSATLPTGGSLEQADGTAWMAFYCQNMLEMALILADFNDLMYAEIAFKFVHHFLQHLLRHGPRWRAPR